jgi:ABC-type branched-chain amino acid transport systems, ATPase component
VRSANHNPLFQITDLSHSFGGLKAISHFDLTLKPGEIWGLIGPNGAGKTTVFNLITGVYKPDEGSVTLNGVNLTRLPSHAIIAQGVSRTFQNIRLFKSMTVLDNVRTAAYCRLDYSLVSALVRTAGFRDEEERLRQSAIDVLGAFNLAHRIMEPAQSLPYGLQRTIELARALVSRPKVLLLDEPGAGMNPAEIDKLAETILWVRDNFGVAIVLIEHRMQLVMKLCEQVKVLNFGETIFQGKPGDLAKDETVVRAYFGDDHGALVN